jgi:hypothetical protein
VDPIGHLPSSLLVPGGGQLVIVTWRAEVGAEARPGDLAVVLKDLQQVIEVGERWGTALARSAAHRQVTYELRLGGLEAGLRAARSVGFNWVDVRDFAEWISSSGLWRLNVPPYRDPRSPEPPPGRPSWGPDEFIRLLADARLPDLMGSPAGVRRLEYRNPLEVILTGSGFLILGTIYVLRIVRDWSSKRREGAAAAREAEAAARRKAAGADLLEWLVEEAKKGRLHVPPGELLNLVGAADARAMRRLAAENVQLQLPPGADPASQ